MIKGLKKAIGDYQRANAGGQYNPRYGYLMYDKNNGYLWTDEFYDLGHGTWKEYHTDNIICISKLMTDREIEINMKNVKDFIEEGSYDMNKLLSETLETNKIAVNNHNWSYIYQGGYDYQIFLDGCAFTMIDLEIFGFDDLYDEELEESPDIDDTIDKFGERVLLEYVIYYLSDKYN